MGSITLCLLAGKPCRREEAEAKPALSSRKGVRGIQTARRADTFKFTIVRRQKSSVSPIVSAACVELSATQRKNKCYVTPHNTTRPIKPTKTTTSQTHA